MKKPNIYRRLRVSLNTLHLADKCLLVFMAILMLQSAYNLFFHGIIMQENNKLDVVVRTTAAAIFGYFISANFQNGSRGAMENEQYNNNVIRIDNVTSDTGSQPKAKFGFSAKAGSQELKMGDIVSSCKTQPECRNRLQIIVVAAIGVFALVILLIARNHIATSDASASTISQLRDFVSGSVGFLIGHSTHQEKF